MDSKLLKDEEKVAMLEKVRSNMVGQIEWLDEWLKGKTLEAESV